VKWSVHDAHPTALRGADTDGQRCRRERPLVSRELGFRVVSIPEQAPFLYASLRRDRAEIVLVAAEAPRKGPAPNRRRHQWWDVYIRIHGVWEFYESLRDKKFVTASITRQPYGAWEFEVLDPNGYILVFGEFSPASNTAP
jgi:hypothetical protein